MEDQREHDRRGEQGQHDPAGRAVEGLGEFLECNHRCRNRNHVRGQQADPGLGQAERAFDGGPNPVMAESVAPEVAAGAGAGLAAAMVRRVYRRRKAGE